MKIDIKHLVYTLFLLFIPFSDAQVMANTQVAILTAVLLHYFPNTG